MCHRQGSAGSARPISEQCENMVESAGIAVQPNEIGNKNPINSIENKYQNFKPKAVLV